MPANATTPLLSEFPPTPYEEWRRAAEESLEGAPFEKKLVTRLPEGIDLQPIYTAANLAAAGVPEGWPGVPPFTRGARATGARLTPALIAQELPYGTAEEFNRALRLDVARGQTAVNLSLDVATRRGIDPDAAAAGEVGACGLSVAGVEDLAVALDGVDPARVPVLAWPGASALAMTAIVAAWCDRRGFPVGKLRGGLLADPLTEWARDGQLPAPRGVLMDEMAGVLAWASAAPELATIGIQANLWAEAGGHAVQELAFGIATGVDYLREMDRRGHPVQVVAPRCVVTLSLGAAFFTEVAKIRAARLLWSRVVAAAGGDAAAQRLRIHGRTAVWNKTVLDPYVNVLRATSEAFAGLVGGVDSLHVSPFDETVRPPDDFSRRVARNIPIILAEECHLRSVADPAGGSWYVETLTLELAKRAWDLFRAVESRGGMAAALEAGFPQSEVAAAGTARVDAVAKRRASVVGVNAFPNLRERPLPVADVVDPGRRERLARKAVERRTGGAQDEAVLARLADLLAAPAERRVEAARAAAAAGATLGELTRTIRPAAASEREITRVRAFRRSEGWESLRATAEAHRQRTGALPRVWLANMGPAKQHRARAEFCAAFLAAGGFDVQSGRGAKTPEEAAAAAAASAAPVVVLCSTDDTYPALVPPFVSALRAAAPAVRVLLAGLPADQVEAHKAAGIDDFIHLRLDAHAFLSALQKQLSIG